MVCWAWLLHRMAQSVLDWTLISFFSQTPSCCFVLPYCWMGYTSAGSAPEPILCESYHPTVQDIIIQHNRIGWAPLFWRRFGMGWSQHQQCYNSSPQWDGNDDLNQYTSLAWQANLIQLICWEQWCKLWKHQNQGTHGHCNHTQAEASKC